MTDVWLKLTGSEAQAVAALRTLGLDREMIRRPEEGPPKIGDVYGPEVSVHFEPNLLTVRATHDKEGKELTPEVRDGPHLMVRFLSRRLKDLAAQKIIEHRPDLPDRARQLPQGLKVIPDPGTVVWA